MLAGNYVPEWPPIAARTGRALRPCWPGKMAICIDRLLKQLAENEGISEQPKAQDQMAWVQRMNNVRNRAEEIVNAEVIFA